MRQPPPEGFEWKDGILAKIEIPIPPGMVMKDNKLRHKKSIEIEEIENQLNNLQNKREAPKKDAISQVKSIIKEESKND